MKICQIDFFLFFFSRYELGFFFFFFDGMNGVGKIKMENVVREVHYL